MPIFTENSTLNFLLIFSNTESHLKFSKFTGVWSQEESTCSMVMSQDQKLTNESQPRIKVKLSHKSNYFPYQTQKYYFKKIYMFPQ